MRHVLGIHQFMVAKQRTQLGTTKQRQAARRQEDRRLESIPHEFSQGARQFFVCIPGMNRGWNLCAGNRIERNQKAA